MKLKNNKIKLKNKNIISNKIDISNYYIFEFIEGWSVIKDKTNNRYGWISEDYNKIINPIYDLCWDFSEGFGIFKKDDKEFFISECGKILREGYDNCQHFKEGFGRFQNNDKCGWLDKTGKILKEGLDYCSNFEGGFARYLENGKEGWIDTSGKTYTKQPY